MGAETTFNSNILKTTTKFDAVNPYRTLPTRLEELPKGLNPFMDEGVKIHMAVLQPFEAPLNTIKTFPVFYMLHEAYENGELHGKKTVVEGSSGNTGKALAKLAPYFGIEEAIIYVHESTSPEKIRLMEDVGAEVRPIKSSVEHARDEGNKQGYINLGQYENPRNYMAYQPIGRMLWEQTQGADLFVAGIGTGGTLIGIDSAIRKEDSDNHVTTLGVIPKLGEAIPGIRDANRLQEVRLPWSAVVSPKNRGILRTISREDAYQKSYSLWKDYDLPAGPSAGAQLAAIHEELQERRETNTLDDLRRKKDDEIVVVFIAPDSYEAYQQDYRNLTS